MIYDPLRFGSLARQRVGVSKICPILSIVLLQLNRALKLCNGLRQSSFLLIGSAQKVMGIPVSRVEFDATTQLLNRLVVLARENQNRSHEEISFQRNRIELLTTLRFREGLVSSPHSRHVPGVVSVGPRIVGIQFNGSSEFLLCRLPIPVEDVQGKCQ